VGLTIVYNGGLRIMTADDLVALFDLTPAGDDRFTGHSPHTGWRRVFGGQVLAQALVAAERTVTGREPHSLHAYFLLGGDPKAPILYEVERVRDGRSFTTRRVVARQRDAAIFVMTASFHATESGLDHAAPPPNVPPPDACADPYKAVDILEGPARFRMKGMLDTTWPIEFRPTDLARYAPDAGPETRQSFWMRIGERLPDDPALHRAALVYLSDMTLLDAALRPHALTIYDHRLQVASLDHAFWFHRPARADNWLLYAQDSPNASGATGLVRGLLYAEDGTLIASVAQEGLLRLRNGAGPSR
jgi:acyl-CoA thioesterase II